MAAEAWTPDLLGAPFEQRTLPLGEDAEGELVATLVRSLPGWRQRMLAPLNDVDVLYVHGWSDFFFQTELARAWNDLGARFYALDLRKYGRSLRDGQAPGYVDSLDTYDADIAAALAAMGLGDQPSRRLVLLGHSTGGLVLTLWSARNPGRASALILNSPWLELQTGALARQALSPVLRAHARVAPLAATPAIDMGFYARAQGEIGSLPNLEGVEHWRPAAAFPIHPGWLNAILAGHQRVAAGVDVGCPALVLLSARSTPPFKWVDALTSTDSVLTVDDVARAAVRIGSMVTLARIEGAIHDVFLSRAAPRAHAYGVMRRWATQTLRD
ncbi:Lysophospholipase, alpha-beta hydrolase superfamily [Agrococcus baldri]|uniref:Lysophospholipase, alpha-beta hydrolase superfamily n=1 Tax=Agrococcus baldri TaxID=153730 RepID=A0AA94HM71_9MICO|nr:alpha/beta hydrolase [Agrococcus baldri]SFS08766.1 Lysophospholipase, alpha-beta hydrolase superfamily [Agrococcus baldri]